MKELRAATLLPESVSANLAIPVLDATNVIIEFPSLFLPAIKFVKEGAGACTAKTDAIAAMVARVTRRQVCASALMDGWAQNASCLVRT